MADIDMTMIEHVHSVIDEYKPDWQLAVIDTGEKCLDAVKNEEQYDVVLLGMKLSDMSCFELIWQIRDDSDIPVLILSYDNDIKILVRAFEAGASEYMTCPFNKDVLIARLKALVRRRKWDANNFNEWR
jgi:DNA-binding response OmpR family regulator